MAEIFQLTDSIRQLKETAQTTEEKISVGLILDQLEERSFGGILLLLGMLQIIVGIVPGVTDFVVIFTFLISGQMVFNRSQPWVPRRLRLIEIDKARLLKILDKLLPWGQRFDRWFHRRFSVFVLFPSRWLAALCCVILSILIFFLGFIPIPGLASVLSLPILAFGIGMAMKDGLVMLVGFCLLAGAYALSAWLASHWNW